MGTFLSFLRMLVDAMRRLVHFWCSRHWLGMQARPTASLHRPIAFGFWLLSTCAVGAACSDDGNLLGSENSAGSGAQAGSGSAQAGSGSAQAGSGVSAGAAAVAGGGGASAGGSSSQAGHAGTSSGGAMAGTAGAGGTAACDFGLCARANVCFDHCGGTVVYTGCCPCAANTVEQLVCEGAGGAGSGDCVGETCAANETCVAHRTVGGAIMPPDQNNQCMTGRHLEGSMCQADFSYSCATLTGCSAPSATCRCAAGTDCAGTTVCRLPQASAWLDTDAELVCELLAP